MEIEDKDKRHETIEAGTQYETANAKSSASDLTSSEVRSSRPGSGKATKTLDANTDGHFMERSRVAQYLISLPRTIKSAILMAADWSLLCFALWCAYSLRLGELYLPATATLFALLISAPTFGVLCFQYNGLYRMVTRYVGRRGAVTIVISVVISVLLWCLVIFMGQFTLSSIPRSVVVMYGLFAVLFVWGSRRVISFLLNDYISRSLNPDEVSARPVLIYGVGEEGRQLYQDLVRSPEYKLAGFVDDNETLWRQNIYGVKVFNPKQIESLIKSQKIEEIFLADPALSRKIKRNLINVLAPYSVSVKALPALHDIASGKVQISDLRSIGLNDLLGRRSVPPKQTLLLKTVREKVVMITGAGGSIGSEIARQVAGLEPTKLILLECSELALFEIERETRRVVQRQLARGEIEAEQKCEIISVLGSVLDEALISSTIQDHGVNTIFHAAAYKHVPIVEDNPFAGVENNVFGTRATARAAQQNGVEHFVLISTDKAVRPTNVMGASKRVAELVLQALAEENDTKTIFTMVRFGNVLGSSGSVVARFQEQIKNGGPVTVTDPEIIRYFMTIPEAAQLVIQAGGLARGGDVFVLDMGLPVKIVDLAKAMINLSGLEVADEQNPDGDIAIEYIGLRDGEKLYEELLINENCSPTDHVSIIRNHENFLAPKELDEKLLLLADAISDFDRKALEALLNEMVEGYQSSFIVSETTEMSGAITKAQSF